MKPPPLKEDEESTCRYGDLAQRNVRGVVLEAFGVGNMPDLPSQGYLPWLKKCVKQGIKVCRPVMLFFQTLQYAGVVHGTVLHAGWLRGVLRAGCW